MQMEAAADFLHHLGFMQAMHVEPELRAGWLAGLTVGDLVETGFGQTLRAILDKRDRCMVGLAFAQMDQRTSRQS